MVVHMQLHSAGMRHGPRQGGQRTLSDFFPVNRTPKRSKSSAEPSCCLRTTPIPGLRILTDFVTIDEEKRLLDFLDQQEWRTDLARRVIHYGGTYCLMPPKVASPEQRHRIENTVVVASPIPNELELVINYMIGHKLYNWASVPKYCIVNEYKERQGISAHVESFRFSSPVCGLTLCNGDWMRFHQLQNADDGSVRSGKAQQAARTGQVHDIWMPRRSLLVMDGEARGKWQHEIVRSKKGRAAPGWRRVSLTFRTDTTC